MSTPKRDGFDGALSPLALKDLTPDERWRSDGIQFPRLLAEIHACGLREDQYEAIAESMDLTVEQIDELLDRATEAFDRMKAAL